MTFPSYHLQQTSVQNQDIIHKNYVRPFVVGGNFSHDSESGSDDCNNQKAKKRSHRPRGCRGGGSRRARKERRELQFLEMKRQQQEHMQLMNVSSYPTNICHGNTHQVSSVLPPSLSSSTSSTSTSISFLSFPHMAEGTYLQQTMGLPYLQSSLSFSSNESEPSEKLITSSTTSNFDILPSMPSEIQRGDPQRLSGQCYRSMAALPPLSSATSSTFHTSQPQKSAEDILHSNLSYTQFASISAQNITTEHVQLNVNPQIGKSNFKDEITKILPSNKKEKIDNWIVSQSTSIPTRNTTSASHSNDSSLSAGNKIPNGERFFLTRKILSETGNSFFATSPKSFLLGKKKSPVFCF